MKKSFLFFVLGVVLTFSLSLLLFFIHWQFYLHSSLLLPEEGIVYTLKPGTSVSSLARALHQQGYLSKPRYFVLLAQYRGVTKQLQAGEYLITAATTPKELLEQMTGGEIMQRPFRIVEGQTVAEIRANLGTLNIRAVLTDKSTAEIATKLGISLANPEGYFFPDTYYYHTNTTDFELLQRAHGKMLHVLYDSWSNKQRDLPYATPYEALIAASIIEKETALGSERATIAGVIVNRLRKNMRLQLDPTVIYGLGEDYQGDITHEHLRRPTPYNTYVRRGLPITPIAAPGRSAIVAALHPEEHNYFYFVAKGDGSHVFSVTLDKHNLAVEKLIQSGRH